MTDLTTPPANPWLDAARRLAPGIRAAAPEIARGRALSAAVVDGLAEADLFRMLVPASSGGAELDLPRYVAVIEELGRADTSVGWCVAQASGFSMVAARMAPDGAAEVFGSGPRACVANGPSPTGTANLVDGGFRLSGRWSFSSGIRHATWLSAFAQLRSGGLLRLRPDGTPETRFLLFPAREAEQIDTWDVAGLRGTGSFDFAVEDLFVPARRSVSVPDDPLREPGALYAFPQRSVWAFGFAVTALGTARTALDAVETLAVDKVPFRARGALREQALAQGQIGEGEAHWRAGRALLYEVLHRVWDAVCVGGEITLAERVEIRLATTHAIRLAARAVDLCYDVGASSSLFADSPLQRCFQDMHAITQHLQSRLQHYESAGRFFLGLEPDTESL